MNIKDLIGEATEYDKKLEVEIKEPKSWCKSVSAFANTLGGKLIFGIADESPIRCSRLFCTRWNGLNKMGGTIDAFDDAEYSGSVLSLIDNGESFIKRNAKMMWRKTANSREEMPEDVERSYHEALVNALAHRDYLVNGSEVHIDIYDDRMEIYSPGGMPDGSVIQDRDPLTVPSTKRDPVLADVFNRLGYMERKGSGYSGHWEIL